MIREATVHRTNGTIREAYCQLRSEARGIDCKDEVVFSAMLPTLLYSRQNPPAKYERRSRRRSVLDTHCAAVIREFRSAAGE